MLEAVSRSQRDAGDSYAAIGIRGVVSRQRLSMNDKGLGTNKVVI